MFKTLSQDKIFTMPKIQLWHISHFRIGHFYWADVVRRDNRITDKPPFKNGTKTFTKLKKRFFGECALFAFMVLFAKKKWTAAYVKW